jgi:hypothetical protein
MLPTVPGLRPTAQVLLKSRRDAVALVRRSKEGGPTMEVASVQVFLSLLKLGNGRRQAPGGAQPGTGKDGVGLSREAPSDPYGHGHVSWSPSAPGDAPWYPNGGPPVGYGPQQAPLYGYGQWESYAGYSAWGSHPPEAGPFWSEASAYRHWAQHVAPHWAQGGGEAARVQEGGSATLEVKKPECLRKCVFRKVRVRSQVGWLP